VNDRRRTLIVVIGLVIVPLVVVLSGALWLWWQIDPPGGQGAKVEVQIPRDCGVSCIGDELSHEGVISSSLIFSMYAKVNSDAFKAGTYELHKHMGISKAVRALRKGPRIDYTLLTIPPGFWISEIAGRVAHLGYNKQTFIDSTVNNAVRSKGYEPGAVNNLEGLLWPDTYKISDSEDEIQILETMVQTFQDRANGIGLATANVAGYGPYDIIKVASLIEAEAKTAKDRPLIASVIYNRLTHNPPMPLQIDATLIYARGNPNDRALSDKDKQIDSPYNTYLHMGLPPTPIAAPSLASLEAALHPAQTDYLYYVVIDKQGDHAFASTLAGHQANIDAARRAGVLP
jgi:UPF0755 protein